MRPRTRELATEVQQSLLALSNDNLGETITSWLLFLLDRLEQLETCEDVCQSLGCSVRSPATDQEYASLSELDRAEPAVGDVVFWVFPDAQTLRELLGNMPLKQFYHQVIGLAGDVFREKPWAAYWGEPPSQQGSGVSFMTSLAHYLQVKKGMDTLSTEQFEAWYQELLGIVEPTEFFEGEEDPHETEPHERQWRVRVEFLPFSKKEPRLLAELLQRTDCTVTLEETGSALEGVLEYAPWRKDDLKALARARRLLNRWQREGDIQWSEWKVKPPKRRSSYRGKRQRKATQHSRSTRKKS